jgi:hypothetical protein
MFVATREILERKSFNNKAIVLDEMRLVEEIIKRKGLRGQTNLRGGHGLCDPPPSVLGCIYGHVYAS